MFKVGNTIEENFFWIIQRVIYEQKISPIAKLIFAIICGDLNSTYSSEDPEPPASLLTNRDIGTTLGISDCQVSTKIKELKTWGLITVKGRRLRKIRCTFEEPIDPSEKKLQELRDRIASKIHPSVEGETTTFRMVQE